MFDFRFLILFGKFQNQPDRRSAEKKSQFIVIEFESNEGTHESLNISNLNI